MKFLRLFFTFLLVIYPFVFSLSQNINELSDNDFEKYAVNQGSAMNTSIVVIKKVKRYEINYFFIFSCNNFCSINIR